MYLSICACIVVFMSVQRRPKTGKDKNGKVKWIVRWRDKAGSEHSRSFDTERDAKSFDVEMSVQKKRGKSPDSVKARMTLLEYARDLWLPGQQVKQQTLDVYAQTFTHLDGHGIGHYSLADITSFDVQDFYNQLTRGRSWKNGSMLSPRTAGQHLSIVSLIFRDAEEAGYVQNNPCLNVKKSKNIDSSAVERDSIPSMKDVQKIVDTLSRGGYTYSIKDSHSQVKTYVASPNTKIASMVLLSACTGLRMSECLGLTVQDVDTEKKIIKVRKQKTRKSRSDRSSLKSPSSQRDVPYPDTLHLALTSIIPSDSLAGSFVFTPDMGVHALSASHVTTVISRVMSHLRMPYTFHSFRHTYASEMIDAGCPVPVVSRMLGHSSVVTTMSIYVHVLDRAPDTARAHINAIANRVDAGWMRDRAESRDALTTTEQG